MQIERVLAHASKLGEPGFGNAPEAFDAVDVVISLGKFILAMVDTKVLVVSHIRKAIAAFDPIGFRTFDSRPSARGIVRKSG